MPGVGDEGAADLAAFLGADRDVLQVRLGGGEAAGGGGGERVAGVHPLGLRIDVVRQRVGIGRAQLGDLPPVEDLLRQFVALLGEVFQRARARRPCPVLVLVPPGRPILPNRMSPSCFGLPGLIGAPASLLDLGLQPRRLPARTRPTAAPASAGRSRCRAAPCAPAPAAAAAPASRKRWSCARRRAAA